MTKAMLQTIKAEFEHTPITMNELCEKYSCAPKDLIGRTTWRKNPQNNPSTAVKLIYETIFSPNPEHYLEQTAEEQQQELIVTAEKIQAGQIIEKKDFAPNIRDGFEGLRMLDAALQSQALSLITSIGEMMREAETPQDIKHLVTSHTAIRDSYFNTKAPMVNIMNGDVVSGDKNELATLLEGVQDDC